MKSILLLVAVALFKIKTLHATTNSSNIDLKLKPCSFLADKASCRYSPRVDVMNSSTTGNSSSTSVLVHLFKIFIVLFCIFIF